MSKGTETRLMDVTTAKFIIDKFESDPDAFPTEFNECPKCGAIFIKKLGHDCKNVFTVPWHTDVDELEVE